MTEMIRHDPLPFAWTCFKICKNLVTLEFGKQKAKSITKIKSWGFRPRVRLRRLISWFTVSQCFQIVLFIVVPTPPVWFAMPSVYFVSINKCNCFSSSPALWRRNTFLRTTLCLPCDPWFWLDRHWRATRFVRGDISNLWILYYIWTTVPAFNGFISNSTSPGDRHDAKSSVWLFETQIRGKVSQLWPFQNASSHPASFLIPRLPPTL